MAVEWEFDVRELPREHQRTDYKDFFRVHVSPAVMQALRFAKGDLCNINRLGRSVGPVLTFETSSRGTKTKDIHIARQLLDFYDLDPGIKVSLTKSNTHLPNAKSVTLCETRHGESRDAPLKGSESAHWAWLLEYEIFRAETVSPCMVLEGVCAKGQKRSFKIQSIDDSRGIFLYRIPMDCEVQIVSGEEHLECESLLIPQGDVGGLAAQIMKLNECIAAYSQVKHVELKARSSPRWANGIILHGPPGAGKSHLLQKVGQAGWRSICDSDADPLRYSSRIDEKIATIRRLFNTAKSAQPAVILIDDLTDFLGIYDNQPSAEALAACRVLRHEMELLSDCRTLVVATTSTLTNIQQTLMTVNGFSERIEIPVPDKCSRAQILKAQSGIPANDKNVLIEHVASRTHGFVAADLVMLLDMAFRIANERAKLDDSQSNFPAIQVIEEGDVNHALRKVKPAAIRGVFVEVPETRWSDIGGQEEVKKFLDRALCRPSKVSIWIGLLSGNADDGQDQRWLRDIGLPTSKGLLLYGPPGCSKTMIARAAATESGYNFIAVKGAEVLNMYVGESERRIREYFHLAKAVSPSVLFFDEIDAIGAARDGSHHTGVNLVTTMLNEMGGIEELKDVFVLAATNRPDMIDRALTRPGRFDQSLYIGPPNLEARQQIFIKYLGKMDVAKDMDITALAAATDGFSGAEIVDICRRAFEAASDDSVAGDDILKINITHFDKAMKRRRKNITPDIIAYFEAYQSAEQ